MFVGRLLYAIVLKSRDSTLHVESTSLAYRTLLSLVPLLAVMFSVLKGFGVQNQLVPFLTRSLDPLGEKGAEIAGNVLDYVNNLNFAVLGYTGLALLFWAVIALLTRVEEAFNAIWQVPGGRSLGRRFSTYLSVTLVGPVLMFSALGATAVVMQDAFVQRLVGIELVGLAIRWLGELVPYLLASLAFAFLYTSMTSARVRAVPALAGGVFASVAWFAVGLLFARFVAGSAQYSAVYSGFAAAVLFVIWLNVGWLIILVGAHVACWWQRPELIERLRWRAATPPASAPVLALEAMRLIARAHATGAARWNLEGLARAVAGGSVAQLREVVDGLAEAGLLVATREQPPTYLLARAAGTIRLGEILAAVGVGGAAGEAAPEVRGLLVEVAVAVDSAVADRTLADLLAAAGATAA